MHQQKYAQNGTVFKHEYGECLIFQNIGSYRKGKFNKKRKKSLETSDFVPPRMLCINVTTF